MNNVTPPRFPIMGIFIWLAVLVNFTGLFVTLMEPDAALYASVSRTMAESNNYLELFRDGNDWLDKPHFPFWITAFSFELFGFTTWAYKLPGVLFLLVGAWYTYLLGKKLYNTETGQLAALILLTAQHIILSNNDVRAEPYLTGLIVASIYHFYNAYRSRRFTQLLLGSAFAACAVMTKGLFALIPVAGAIGGELILKKDWKNLFHWRWMAAAALIVVFIIPELYALYYQFDQHPEKVVFGETNVSGLKFFFWDSQFGRFFNTGPIKGKGDPTFFIHTTVWAFLPWSLLLFTALFMFFKNRQKQAVEWLTVCGSLTTFVVFSLSKFQLPHYLNIVFPLFAIITAQYLYSIERPATLKKVSIAQALVIGVLFSLMILIQVFFKPAHMMAGTTILMFILFAGFLFLHKMRLGSKQLLVFRTVLVSVMLNCYLNFAFYPSLLDYQSGSKAAFWINKNYKNRLDVVVVNPSYGLQFYLDQPVYWDTLPSARQKPFLLYYDTTQDQVAVDGLQGEVVHEFVHYPVTQLKPKFLNKSTRDSTLQTRRLVLIK